VQEVRESAEEEFAGEETERGTLLQVLYKIGRLSDEARRPKPGKPGQGLSGTKEKRLCYRRDGQRRQGK
jgi:hypothetical protein